MAGKKPITYAFIDSQNINLGVRSLGWQLDYRKFRLYLTNKYHVQKAYLFIGKTDGNQNLYDALEKAGFSLVFKPTVAYVEDGKMTMKGNVDAELVLYAAAKVYAEYHQAIIISGDGDFYCLAEFLAEKGKLLHIIVPHKRYSKLLGSFVKYIVRLDMLRPKLAYQPHRVNKKPTHTVGRNLRQSRRMSRSSGRSKP